MKLRDEEAEERGERESSDDGGEGVSGGERWWTRLENIVSVRRRGGAVRCGGKGVSGRRRMTRKITSRI